MPGLLKLISIAAYFTDASLGPLLTSCLMCVGSGGGKAMRITWGHTWDLCCFPLPPEEANGIRKGETDGLNHNHNVVKDGLRQQAHWETHRALILFSHRKGKGHGRGSIKRIPPITRPRLCAFQNLTEWIPIQPGSSKPLHRF